MRFVIINLFLVCLLLLGIGYLAFGDAVCVTKPKSNNHLYIHHVDAMFCEVSLETF